MEIEFNEDDEEVLDITAGDLSLDDLIDQQLEEIQEEVVEDASVAHEVQVVAEEAVQAVLEEEPVQEEHVEEEQVKERVLAVAKIMCAQKVESEDMDEVAEEECQNKENEAPTTVSFDFTPAQAARKAVTEGL